MLAAFLLTTLTATSTFADTDVSAQVSATTSNLVYSRATKLYNCNLTITNNGTALNNQVFVALNNLSTGVTLANAVGAYNNEPYTTVSNSGLPNGASITIPLQFTNPSNTPITFTPVTLSSDLTTASTHLTTATPYQPLQDMSSYEQAPYGFTPVFTEAVVRHGSRGLSSFDATVYNMWQQANADGALTPLGAQLGPDVWQLMQANALLDDGVAGITAPGYGNLSQVGIGEEQQIAARLLQRLPNYFTQLAASVGTTTPRLIMYDNSGVNRAVDSAGFFTQSLITNNPSLGPLVTKTAALTAYPSNKPVAQAAGVNRFLLYFHKLAAKTDLVSNTADPYYQTYQDSLTYQAYLTNTNMVGKVNALLTTPDAKANARAVLLTLFTPDFVNKIDNGTYTFSNTGTFTFNNGQYSTTLTAPGGVTVQSLTDAATELYSLYVIVPAMRVELNNMDFTKYIPDAQANYLAYLDDVQSYYQKGPGITEDNPVTYKMAQILQNDLFNEVDQIAKGNLSHGAVLHFTHAEEIIPLSTIFGLQEGTFSVYNANNYAYSNNPWRGSDVAPLAANVQWDVYSDGNGNLLVKMLYNEKETDFKAACESARYAPGSHFYNYNGLKACYNHVAN
jgi:hypothetical protein